MNKVNPNRLKEIRTMRGLTLEQVATELNVSKQAVSKYEKGTSQPAPESIDKMLSLFEIPRSYLTKDDFDLELLQSPLFFRTKKSTKQSEKEIAATYTQWVYEMLSQTDIEQIRAAVNLPRYAKNISIEEKALELRKDWELGLGAIDNLSSVMEYNGINILAVDSEQAVCDAYSQVIDGIPIIIINRKIGSAVRWRFNLAHELGHLILHIPDVGSMKSFDEIEKEANLFAENFLMPAASFEKCILSTKLDYFTTLKPTWKVSIAAMIYRCDRLQVIEKHRILRLQQQLSKRGWKTIEPLDDELKYEEPKLVFSRIKPAISDKIAADEFFTHLCLPIFDIQKLLGLSKEYFKNMGVFDIHQSIKNEYQQLSLF